MREFKTPDKMYLCDPAKNTVCRKTACFISYGECRCTAERKYAVVDENGKALGYSWERFCKLTFKEDGVPWPPPCAIDELTDTLEHNSSGLVDE